MAQDDTAESPSEKAPRSDGRGGKHPAASAAMRPELPFTKDFPDDPELRALVAAFERGDYAEVRRKAPALAKDTADPSVAAAARELRRRIDPDPLARNLLLAAILLLAVLSFWVFSHRH